MLDAKVMSILLVDPDPLTQEFVLQCLVPEGYLVLDIPNPHEAAKTARDIHFNLLIVEAFLPFKSARELANKMAVYNPAQKVLFLSSYSSEILTTHGVCPPGADILRKPLRRRELLDRVKAALASDSNWKRLAAGPGDMDKAAPDKTAIGTDSPSDSAGPA